MIWPPSNTGIGKRLMTPRLIEITAMRKRKLVIEVLNESEATFPIDSGPPIVLKETSKY